jgi:hypothetical protein
MKDVMKFRIAISALLLTAGSISYGQAIPAGSPPTPISSIGSSAPNLSAFDGVLHYALSASEVIQFGYYGAGQVTNSTVLSGDVSYTGKSEIRPFSLTFAGGVILANQSGQGTSYFSDVSVSQGYVTRHWDFNIADSFSFLPQSPTTGLSGIAGVGDIGSLPVPTPVEGPAGGIFSNAGNRYANTLTGSAERQISRDTSISGSGSWSVLHFLDDNGNNAGLDSSQVSGTVAANRRLDARSSVSLAAAYMTINYSGSNVGIGEPDIESRTISLSYQRVLTRTISIGVSGGPQWTSSSNSTYIPASLNASGSANVSYTRGLTSASVAYSHGVNAGSGVLPGAISDSLFASVGHTYGRKWMTSLTAGYTRSSGLTQLLTGGPTAPVHEVYDTTFGGVQVTRGFGVHFSGYASYTVQDQSNNFPLGAQNALNGTSQTFGIGVSYTPRSTRLGQF